MKKILENTKCKYGVTHLAIKFGVFIEGVVELLGTLLQAQGQRGFATGCPRPVFKVPFFKQGPQILRWTQHMRAINTRLGTYINSAYFLLTAGTHPDKWKKSKSGWKNCLNFVIKTSTK